jgi:hypothetical protein
MSGSIPFAWIERPDGAGGERRPLRILRSAKGGAGHSLLAGRRLEMGIFITLRLNPLLYRGWELSFRLAKQTDLTPLFFLGCPNSPQLGSRSAFRLEARSKSTSINDRSMMVGKRANGARAAGSLPRHENRSNPPSTACDFALAEGVFSLSPCPGGSAPNKRTAAKSPYNWRRALSASTKHSDAQIYSKPALDRRQVSD